MDYINQRRAIEAMIKRQEDFEKKVQAQLVNFNTSLSAALQQSLKTEFFAQALEQALIEAGTYPRLPWWIAKFLSKWMPHITAQDVLVQAQKIQRQYHEQVEAAKKAMQEKQRKEEPKVELQIAK